MFSKFPLPTYPESSKSSPLIAEVDFSWCGVYIALSILCFTTLDRVLGLVDFVLLEGFTPY